LVTVVSNLHLMAQIPETKYRTLAGYTLVTLLVISVISAIAASRIGFDYDFEKFFPQGDNDLFFYLDYREKFENDNDYLLIGFEPANGVFNSDFLTQLDSLTGLFQSIPQVDQVISPTNSFRLIKGPLGWIPVPYLHPEAPERLQQDSINIYQKPTLVSQLFSQKGNAVSLVIKHRQQINRAAADSLMASIHHYIDQFNLPPARLAGKVRAQPVYLKLLQQELSVFLVSSLILVVIILSITYRALWAVVIPLLVVALSGVWILGFMSWVGKPFDLMMVLLPTIIFVVGMSDVIHILTRYVEEIRHGQSPLVALKITFREVGIATFLTSLTTGIGFLTLLTNNIGPIRDFGLYTAIGVLIAYVLAFSLLPSALVFLPSPRITENQRIRKRWRQVMGSFFLLTVNHKRSVVVLSIVLVGLSVIGINQLKVNTYLIDDLPLDHPLKSDFIFFDAHFGGSRPFEAAIMVQDSTVDIFDPPVLREIEKVEQHLLQSYGTSALNSPLTLVRFTNQAVNGGLWSYYQVPPAEEMQQIGRPLSQLVKRPNFAGLITDDLRISRFTGRMPDMGSAHSAVKNQQLKQFISSEIDTSLVKFKVTGTSLLIDKNNAYLVDNMAKGLTIAFAAVALIAGLMFRSWRMVLITLVPNMIPLLLVAGIMGVLGISLKLTTSVIFTVAFGIAVDDTIHFISKLKMELVKGRSLIYAIKRVYFSTGKAIVITTLVLISGFATLLLSSFGGTFYIGLFVGLTLLFALIIDLTLLPVLVLLFYRNKELR